MTDADVPDSEGRLPRDAPWPVKEAAFERWIWDLGREIDDLCFSYEEFDEELERLLECDLERLRGVPGYEYLAEVAARRDQQEQRDAAERLAARRARSRERMLGCADDPRF